MQHSADAALLQQQHSSVRRPATAASQPPSLGAHHHMKTQQAHNHGSNTNKNNGSNGNNSNTAANHSDALTTALEGDGIVTNIFYYLWRYSHYVDGAARERGGYTGIDDVLLSSQHAGQSPSSSSSLAAGYHINSHTQPHRNTSIIPSAWAPPPQHQHNAGAGGVMSGASSSPVSSSATTHHSGLLAKLSQELAEKEKHLPIMTAAPSSLSGGVWGGGSGGGSGSTALPQSPRQYRTALGGAATRGGGYGGGNNNSSMLTPKRPSTAGGGGGNGRSGGRSSSSAAAAAGGRHHHHAAAAGGDSSSTPSPAAVFNSIAFPVIMPSTIIIEQNYPKAWYNHMDDDAVTVPPSRRLGKDIDTSHVLREFLSETEHADEVHSLLAHQNASHHHAKQQQQRAGGGSGSSSAPTSNSAASNRIGGARYNAGVDITAGFGGGGGSSSVGSGARSHLSNATIEKFFKTHYADNKIVAAYFFNDLCERERCVAVEYLDGYGLRQLLTGRSDRPSGFIQKWVPPAGPQNSVIQIVWSPTSYYLTRRLNTYGYNDARVPMYERALTFEGDAAAAHYCTESEVAPHIRAHLTSFCRDFVQYLWTVHSLALRRLVLHVKVDHANRLWFLWASSTRTESNELINASLRFVPSTEVDVRVSERDRRRAEAERAKELAAIQRQQQYYQQQQQQSSGTSTALGNNGTNTTATAIGLISGIGGHQTMNNTTTSASALLGTGLSVQASAILLLDSLPPQPSVASPTSIIGAAPTSAGRPHTADALRAVRNRRRYFRMNTSMGASEEMLEILSENPLIDLGTAVGVSRLPTARVAMGMRYLNGTSVAGLGLGGGGGAETSPSNNGKLRQHDPSTHHHHHQQHSYQNNEATNASVMSMLAMEASMVNQPSMSNAAAATTAVDGAGKAVVVGCVGEASAAVIPPTPPPETARGGVKAVAADASSSSQQHQRQRAQSHMRGGGGGGVVAGGGGRNTPLSRASNSRATPSSLSGNGDNGDDSFNMNMTKGPSPPPLRSAPSNPISHPSPPLHVNVSPSSFRLLCHMRAPSAKDLWAHLRWAVLSGWFTERHAATHTLADWLPDACYECYSIAGAGKQHAAQRRKVILQQVRQCEEDKRRSAKKGSLLLATQGRHEQQHRSPSPPHHHGGRRDTAFDDSGSGGGAAASCEMRSSRIGWRSASPAVTMMMTANGRESDATFGQFGGGSMSPNNNGYRGRGATSVGGPSLSVNPLLTLLLQSQAILTSATPMLIGGGGSSDVAGRRGSMYPSPPQHRQSLAFAGSMSQHNAAGSPHRGSASHHSGAGGVGVGRGVAPRSSRLMPVPVRAIAKVARLLNRFRSCAARGGGVGHVGAQHLSSSPLGLAATGVQPCSVAQLLFGEMASMLPTAEEPQHRGGGEVGDGGDSAVEPVANNSAIALGAFKNWIEDEVVVKKEQKKEGDEEEDGAEVEEAVGGSSAAHSDAFVASLEEDLSLAIALLGTMGLSFTLPLKRRRYWPPIPPPPIPCGDTAENNDAANNNAAASGTAAALVVPTDSTASTTSATADSDLAPPSSAGFGGGGGRGGFADEAVVTCNPSPLPPSNKKGSVGAAIDDSPTKEEGGGGGDATDHHNATDAVPAAVVSSAGIPELLQHADDEAVLPSETDGGGGANMTESHRHTPPRSPPVYHPYVLDMDVLLNTSGGGGRSTQSEREEEEEEGAADCIGEEHPPRLHVSSTVPPSLLFLAFDALTRPMADVLTIADRRLHEEIAGPLMAALRWEALARRWLLLRRRPLSADADAE